MINSSKEHLLNFFKNIFQSYNRLEQQALPNLCKIDGEDHSCFLKRNGEIFVKIIYSGNLNKIDASLDEILSGDFFEYFSSDDKKRLFSFYNNQESIQLKSSFYDYINGETKIFLEDIISGEKTEKTASEVMKDEKIQGQMSKKDIKKITWIFANDLFRKTNDK